MNLYNSKNVIIATTLAILLTLVAYGLVRLAIWSFAQNVHLATVSIDASSALPIAFIVQFGQNAVLVLRSTYNQRNRNARMGLAMIFWVLIFLDALSNYGEWFRTHANPNFDAFADLPTTAAVLFGLTLCGAAVFVEECIALEFAATIHMWNNVLKSMGMDGFKILELVSEGFASASGVELPKNDRPDYAKGPPTQGPKHPQHQSGGGHQQQRQQGGSQQIHISKPGDSALRYQPQEPRDYDTDEIVADQPLPPTPQTIRLPNGKVINVGK